MNRRPRLLVGAIALVVAVGGISGFAVFSSEPAAIADDSEPFVGTGPLDGLTFHGSMGPVGKPATVEDRFVFSQGAFVSTECRERCKYPARPYFVRKDGDAIAFVSETKCPYKDAKIVWRGTVKDGRVEGVSTWSVNRWYWTVENEFWFEGTLSEGPATTSSG